MKKKKRFNVASKSDQKFEIWMPKMMEFWLDGNLK